MADARSMHFKCHVAGEHADVLIRDDCLEWHLAGCPYVSQLIPICAISCIAASKDGPHWLLEVTGPTMTTQFRVSKGTAHRAQHLLDELVAESR